MIYIRTDANEQIATGHMMRCKTIAYELDRRGKKVVFLVSDNDSGKLLKDGQFQYRILNTRWDDLGTKEELEIMKDILKKSRKAENEIPVLFVDSYFVDNDYFSALKRYAKVVFLDDLAENTYDVDVLINYNVTYEKYDYYNRYKDKKTRLILGPAYVPLRRQFGEKKIVRKTYNADNALSILIMCGGGDTENVIYTIIDHLRQKELLGGCYYNIVVGAYNPNIEAIRKLTEEYCNVNILYNVSDMATIMRKCDLAITAASTVLYECCATGLPTAFFTVADNQEPDAAVFSEKYKLIYLGDFRKDRGGVLENIEDAIRYLSSDILLRQTMSENMQKIVDGKGAWRIVNIIERVFETGSFFEEETIASGEKTGFGENISLRGGEK